MMNNGNCVSCPSGCKRCSETECLECEANKIKKNGSCIPCPTDCKRCGENGCLECQPWLNLSGTSCICPEDCLRCNQQGCQECEQNFRLVDSKCEKVDPVEVNYIISQRFGEELQATFLYQIALDIEDNFPSKVLSSVKTQLLNNTDKISVAISGSTNTPKIALAKEKQRSNIYYLAVTVDNLEEIKNGEKLAITIRTERIDLDPEFNNPANYYFLKPKSEIIESEYYNSSQEVLSTGTQAAASIASSSTNSASSFSLGAGVLISIVSSDPNGVLLKFSQFLTMVKLLKLIGVFFGSSLQDFIY